MTKNAPNYLMCVASGLLLGLSVPSFSWLPLGFLAWIWLVPLLFELKKARGFGEFFKLSVATVGIGFTLITFWVVNASVLGLLASMLMGTVVWATPFLWFYVIKRFLNWNAALFSLPFFWTAWEWLYHQTAFSFGAVRLGYTQADMLWLIQYADLTGVEGVTFWLVLLNISIYFAAEKLIEAANGTEVTPAGEKYSAAFRRLRGGERATVLLPVLLLIAPLVYTAYVFLKPESPARKITVLAIQPNVSPFVRYTPKQMTEIFGKQLVLTAKGIRENPADLILWHEVAVPYILSEDAAATDYLAGQLKKWNTPVLTGLIEVKNYEGGDQRPPLLEAKGGNQEFFNAAAMFKPEYAEIGWMPTDLEYMYRKRRLMPFLEQVPFAERFPVLSDLVIPIGVRPRLSAGDDAKTFDFKTKSGETARVGTMICYENLYPEMSADLVRDGAQFLTAITNEGFFAESQGQYQLAAFSRFRSIETRRSLVRAAATGMTWTTDKYGRVTAQVPMRSEQILPAIVELSDEQTVYVRWGNFFPVFCAVAVLFLSLATVGQAFYRRSRRFAAR